jgi:ferric-dicitrate binding protein FerR (iron transport regulator)
MGDKRSSQDPIREAAWSWVTMQHERESFTESLQAEFGRWLAADPAHAQAYEKASRLWLFAGLVPPATDIDIPGCSEPDGR